MRNKFIKYGSLIFLLLPLIFICLPWYDDLVSGILTENSNFSSLKGTEVLIADNN